MTVAARIVGAARSAGGVRSGSWRRRGVTLMELLLVLVLLVIAGSLVIPAITGAFSGVRLRRAGDAVITRWAEARARAIETGAIYQFRFAPETGSYRLEPWLSVEQQADASSGPKADSDSAENADDSPAKRKTLDESPTIEAKLPAPITFQGGQAARDDPMRRERRVDSLQTTAESWSTPVLFFPDGTASQATVVLQNDARQYMRLTIRGLTGVVRASNVMTREEIDKSSDTR